MLKIILIIIAIIILLIILYLLKEIMDYPLAIAIVAVIIVIVSYLFTKFADQLWPQIFAPAPVDSPTEIVPPEPKVDDSDNNVDDSDNNIDVEDPDKNDETETAASNSSNDSDHQSNPEDDKPVETYLTSLQQTDVNKYIQIDQYCEKDNRGNTYSQGLNIYARSDGFSSGRGFVEYALSGKYKTLKGTLYVPYESRNKEFKSIPMFRIYGDDQLVYSGPAIEGKDKPVDFVVNVEGVRFLKVCIQGGWYKGDGTGLIPCICAGNLILSVENDVSVTKDLSLPKLYLTDLPLYDSKSLFSSQINDYLSDIDGNKYYIGDVIANGGKTGFAEFQIDGEYSTLKGTAYVPSVSAGKTYKLEPFVKIYVNDDLKKEITLDSEDSPVEFSVDISGAEFIKIEGSGGLYVNGDWVPGICVSGLGLY